MSLNDIVLALTGVATIVAPLIANIKKQIENIENKEYRKAILYLLALVCSIAALFLLRATSIIDLAFLKDLNKSDIVVTGIILGNMVTMGVDVKSSLVRSNNTDIIVEED